MAVWKKEIAHGIHLNILETDKFKTNYVSVNFVTPLDKRTAASNALLPMVLKRGTEQYPDMAKINEQLDFLYATRIGTRIYKRGEMHIWGFCASLLDNSYAPDGTDILGGAFDMFQEIIFHPVQENGVFKKTYVASEKSNLTDSIRAKINNKDSYAVWRCQEEMCKEEVYGVPESGTVEDVEAITAESLYAYYQEVLKTAQIEIFFVGKCDKEALAAKATAIFGKMERGTIAKVETKVIRLAQTVKEIVEEQPVNQGKLSLGFRTGSILTDENYAAFSLFAELYGGSPSSKLFMNVREKLSLCYYCRVLPESQKGIMIVASGIEVKNKQKTQDEVLAQLECVKNGVITDEEFQAAKKSLVNGYREIMDSAASLETWYLGRLLAEREATPQEVAEKVKQVSKEEVAEMAKKITLDTIYFLSGTLTGGNDDE